MICSQAFWHKMKKGIPLLVVMAAWVFLFHEGLHVHHHNEETKCSLYRVAAWGFTHPVDDHTDFLPLLSDFEWRICLDEQHVSIPAIQHSASPRSPPFVG